MQKSFDGAVRKFSICIYRIVIYLNESHLFATAVIRDSSEQKSTPVLFCSMHVKFTKRMDNTVLFT